MIDPFELALLPRDKPLKIYENASGFTCAICGVEAVAWAYRVTLPQHKGKACSNCAGDHGWEVR